MNQSNIIAGSLVLGFFVFIVTRGELNAYLAVFLPSKRTASPAVTSYNPLAAWNAAITPLSTMQGQAGGPPNTPTLYGPGNADVGLAYGLGN